MSKPAPVRRTLTVCQGRDTIGFISELWDHRFSAEDIDGRRIGLFATTAAAAEAINADRHKRNAVNGSAQ